MSGGTLAELRWLADAGSRGSTPGDLLVFLLPAVLAFAAVGQFVVRCAAAHRRVQRASSADAGASSDEPSGRVFMFGGGAMARQTGSTTIVFIGASRSKIAIEEVQVLRSSRTTIDRDDVELLRWTQQDRSVALEIVSGGTSNELVRHPSVASLVTLLARQGWPVEPPA